jgi:hypothetical protein
LIIETAVVFGYLLKFNRAFWSSGKFWQAILGSLMGHATVLVLVLSRLDHVTLVIFVLLSVAEVLLYQAIIDRCCNHSAI